MAARKTAAKKTAKPKKKRAERKPAAPVPSSPPARSASGKIIAPGIYPGISLDAYHGDLCDGLSVSASSLFLMHRSCPAKAFAYHYSNPDQLDDDDTEAKVFGTAAHCLILEGEDAFFQRYVMRPDGMDFRSREGRAWRDANGNREIISASALDTIRAMHKALLAHPVGQWAFADGRPEVTAVAKDAETGIWLKCRPDYLRAGLALNYKTTRDASRLPWQRQAWNLGYSLAASLTVDIFDLLGDKLRYAFVIQEKRPPYLPAVRVLADDFVMGGKMIYRDALRRFADCAAKGSWPGFDEIETVTLPAYADKFLASMESPL